MNFTTNSNMAFPSYTKNWHNTTYDAISPTRPELSAAGKTIFVTGGAGRGTGIAITKSFAKAGASKIAISGRTEKSLVAAKEEIEKAFPKTKVVPFVADVLDAKAMNDAFESLCKVDVLVHNAGAMTDLVPLATADLQDWWKAMEVNVKGSLIVTRAFVKVAAPDASIINTVTAAAHLPPFPDYSSYQVSKVAQNKFFEAVQAEHPELYVYSLHPGVIKSDMSDRTTAHGLALPWDDCKSLITLSLRTQ